MHHKDIENQQDGNKAPFANTWRVVVFALGCMFCGIFLIIVVIGGSYLNRGRKVTINDIKGENIKDYGEFSVSFNRTIKLPNYTKYDYLTNSKRCNKNTFSTDIQLETRTSESFTNTKFDRGHLVPAIDVAYSCATFTMANVAPQIPCFNRGIWSGLEEHIRSNYKNHQIVTVPEYDLVKYIDDAFGQKLYVPIGFYKLVFVKDTSRLVYNIYLKHDSTICGRNFRDVGDYNKLPFFV